ncbi:uncharacterized metal-binding protein YceD (DUF177 family) [Novosphingobium kunmingense]|uniref:Uncharacterized metal-binding protein YceD (DUF177 family) n=1 Tax=Novosphingobium kunmingense TaxID=1211806 RepID=A0A2N0H6J6_9SPHN|nr:DUF177 domain-containing protein [Novosphingobium kunmingense]PKB14556.1 uncharacterized metal-binding protein YceD (DUF177 family) [Novosphingobium kunmingense]
MSELSRLYGRRTVPAAPQHIVAGDAERDALARRFDLVAVNSLEAIVTLTVDGPTVRANGRVKAQIVQSCAVSGEDLPVSIDEPIELRFVPAQTDVAPDSEIELEESDLDDIEMDGEQFDLGEAIAQSLGLAIDPYLTGPQADEARTRAGIASEGEDGPFAALKGLLKK